MSSSCVCTCVCVLPDLVQTVRGVRVCAEERTASYCILLEHTGEFHVGIGDMDISHSISVDWVSAGLVEPVVVVGTNENEPELLSIDIGPDMGPDIGRSRYR